MVIKLLAHVQPGMRFLG